MRSIFLILAAPILLSAAPAPRLNEETRNDLRCHLVMSSVAEEALEKGDDERATHAKSAANFFLERVSRRAPQLDVDGLIQAMAAEEAANGNRPIAEFVPGCIEERMRYLKRVIK